MSDVTPPAPETSPALPNGTHSSPSRTVAKPPRKWLGPLGGLFVFLGMLVFWFANLLYDQLVTHRFGLSPNSLVLGGFAMTGALIYTMAYRLRPDDGISVARLLVTFVLGGLFSTEVATYVELAVSSAPVGSAANQDFLVHSLAGVIEEAIKILTVVIAARGLTVRTARSGLFIGGAVGLGFAAFEDMRYAMAGLEGILPGQSQFSSVVGITLGRDVIGPLEHPIMTALIAAALFAATRNGRFRITPTFVGVYLVIAAVHGLIDTLPILVSRVAGTAANGTALGTGLSFVLAIGLGITWLVYTRGLRRQAILDSLAVPNAFLP